VLRALLEMGMNRWSSGDSREADTHQ
jgi:hypothetical protein